MKNITYILLLCLLAFFACTNETKVESITLNPTEITLDVGETSQIEMIISPISASIYNPTSWKSSNPNIATVDTKGNVSAISAGDCIITGKTETHEAHCKVTVKSPNIQLHYSKAIAFDEGVDSIENKKNIIIRLYNEDISIDSTGSIQGNGNFINLNIYVPVNNNTIPTGSYKISNEIIDFGIKPGALIETNNSYYATGSYLGEYTYYGLNAIFFTEGSVEITNNYTLKCNFVGSHQENITIYFSGDIPIYNTSSTQNTHTIEYTETSITQITIDNEENFNHFQVILANNDTTISFITRTPISTNNLPIGVYHTNYDKKAFTLIPEFSNMTISQNTYKITNATLVVKEKEYSATFTDEKGTKYQINKKNKAN